MHWVRLGLIGKTYRLDGSFFVSERDTAIPKSVRWVALVSGSGSPRDDQPRYSLERSRPQAKRIIAKLKEISTIDGIIPHQGSSLWTSREQIPVDDSQEYLWAELEGRQVVDSDGAAFGTIAAVHNFGAGDIVEVRRADGKSQMLPLTDYYFAMDFARQGPLQLVVLGDIFAEFWTP